MIFFFILLLRFYFITSFATCHKSGDKKASVCIEDAEDLGPFVNHLDGGEDFYVCDLSYGGNCCSASDETEHSMIKEHSERRGKKLWHIGDYNFWECRIEK